MINRLAAGALLAACLFAAAPTSAQSRAPSADQIADLTARARAALPMARLEDGSNISPETPEERARPIVSRAVEIAVIRRGDLSAQMQRCGLDWQAESYTPLMRELRARGWHGKTMAYVGMLHGVSQGTIRSEGREDGGSCDAALSTALKREAAMLLPAME